MSIKLECQIDWTEYNKSLKGLQELTEREVVIGYDDIPHGEDGFTNELLGFWQEYGTRSETGGMHIPPRPAIYRSAFILVDDIENESRLLVNNSMMGKSALITRDLQAIGDKGVEAVQEAVNRGMFTKLADSTVAIKKSKGSLFPEKALIDSQELYASVKYDIK